MQITDCLLDKTNSRPLGNTTLGALVGESGVDQLWDERPEPHVDTLVVHYMSAAGLDPSRPFDLDRILGIFPACGVSSHYLVDREGGVMSLVPEEARAWHCGGSVMPEPDSRQGVNAFSVGVELVATAGSGFTDAQYEQLAALCAAVASRWETQLWVLGHEHVAGRRAVSLGLREEPKTDPGGLFEWPRLAEMLVGQVETCPAGVVLEGGLPTA